MNRKMKNKTRCLAVLLMLIFLSSCSIGLQVTKTTEPSETLPKTQPTPHQELTRTKIDAASLSLEKGALVDLTEVGLKGLRVAEKTAYTSPQNRPLYVYMLNDFRYAEPFCFDSYLAVETGTKVLLCDLKNASYESTLCLGDVDGNGTDEMILHEMVGATGGAGQFVSRIFKLSENGLLEIFNSRVDLSTGAESLFHTGFGSEFLAGKKLKIFNSITGYSTLIDISEKYTSDFFDETGKGITTDAIECDSFFEFSLKNVDADEALEIVGVQYASLMGHAGAIGYANSVLKYNKNTNQFEVIESSFSTTR